MRIACGNLNSPSPHDDRNLPSRSKITTGCASLRLKQYTRSCESTDTAHALTSSHSGGLCQSSRTRYRYLPLPTICSICLPFSENTGLRIAGQRPAILLIPISTRKRHEAFVRSQDVG